MIALAPKSMAGHANAIRAHKERPPQLRDSLLPLYILTYLIMKTIL